MSRFVQVSGARVVTSALEMRPSSIRLLREKYAFREFAEEICQLSFALQGSRLTNDGAAGSPVSR